MSDPGPSTPAKRGRKRKNESEVKEKKRLKEEEKENRLVSASSTPSTSDSSRESSNPIDGVERKPRKGKPVKLQELQKTLETCPYPEVLYKNFMSVALTEKRFLTRNVRQKTNILLNKGFVRKSAAKKIVNTLPEIEKTLNLQNENVIFNIKFNKINSWASLAVPMTPMTSTSLVQSFIVFVYDDGRVFVKDNLISIVPVLARTPESEAMFCDKTVELDKKEQDKVKMIFLAVNATRISAKVAKEDRSRRSKAAAVAEKEFNSQDFETVFRYGSKLMYERDTNVDKLNDGIQHIILVDKEEHPKYAQIFGDEKPCLEWIHNVDHLKFVDRANREVENSHLPRLIMTTDVPDRPDGNEDDKVSGAQRKDQAPAEPAPNKEPSSDDFTSRLRLSLECLNGTERDEVVGVTDNRSDPIRRILFPTEESFKTNFKMRFPCFQIKQNKAKTGGVKYYVHPNRAYFTDNVITPFASMCDYRHPRYRGVARMRNFIVRRKRVANDEEPMADDDVAAPAEKKFAGAERNRVPGSDEKKYGLDFYQTSSQQTVISCKYMNRINDLVPRMPSDVETTPAPAPPVETAETEPTTTATSKGRKRKEGTLRNEFYPINNAKMFSDCVLFKSEEVRLTELSNPSSEMQVVETPVTKKQTEEFNQKLAVAADYIRKMNLKKGGRAASDTPTVRSSPAPSDQSVRVGFDTDGRPIPTCFELFFPYGKTELYNVLLRYFYSEAGHRPGYFNAEWKARVMTGFIQKHWSYVFDKGLGGLFTKQLQVIATTSPGWKQEHFDFPIQKFKELKKKWRLQSQQVKKESH